MGYRPLRKVFGESNLERKCGLLFGSCLFLSIFIAFLLVDWVAERLVEERRDKVYQAKREQGAAYVDVSLMKLHFRKIAKALRERATPDESELSAQDDPQGDADEWNELKEWQDFLDTVSEEFDNQGFQYTLIADGRAATANEWEREHLTQLAEEAKSKFADSLSTTPDPELEPPRLDKEEEAPGLSIFARRGVATLFTERVVDNGSEQQYHYYQPIYYKDKCKFCHNSLVSVGAISAAEGGVPIDRSEPIEIAKVVVPIKAEMTAENQIRAILLAVGCGAWFLAMIALYVIVKYLIIKPLGHLRDVSDDISRGNTQLRADLETRDEFQDLAESFNRMLHHLTDAQVGLEDANQSLDAKVDELAQLNMRLYEMNRLKDDFLANMSHELRTPLNSIIGFSEVLHGLDALTEKQRRYAGNIQTSGRLLLEIINDILDLAKIEAGKMELRLSEFKISNLIEVQCDMVRGLADEKNIDLVSQTSSDDEPMYQDQAKVLQILTNLLSNAIKFTPEGGRITVSTERIDDNRLILNVTDTGVGIAEEDRKAIFEKFRQSRAVLDNDGLTREYSGTGLGLSIVKELCKLLGGEIMVFSQLGKGSTFRVTLPWALSERAKPKLTSKLDELNRASTMGSALGSIPKRLLDRQPQTTGDDASNATDDEDSSSRRVG